MATGIVRSYRRGSDLSPSSLRRRPRPRWVAWLALLALAAALAACAPGGGRGDDGVVRVIGPSGVFADVYRKFVIAPFEAAHPDIRVEYQPSPNSAQTLALLTLQQGQPQADVVLLDAAVAIRAGKQGLLAPLDAPALTHLADYPAWARMAGGRALAFSQDNLVVVYNTERVPRPPTRWKELADPKYKGRIAAKLTDTRGVILLPILDRALGVDYTRGIEPALALLRRIGDNVSTWEPSPDCYAVVQSGEADLSICWNARAQYLHDTQGGRIDTVVPQEGTVGQLNTIGLVAGSTQANKALQFIDHALGPQAQAEFALRSYYGPVNPRVQLPAAVATRIHGPAAPMTLDWDWIAERYAAWIQRINREVILSR